MDVAYIKGFFDRLCCVDEGSRAIALTTNQVDLARRVGAAIRMMRISCSISILEGRVKLRISGRESLERWRTEVGFMDPNKAEALERVLASYGGGKDGEPEQGSPARSQGADQTVP